MIAKIIILLLIKFKSVIYDKFIDFASELAIPIIYIAYKRIYANFIDMASLVPDYHNKINLAIKRVIKVFLFPSICESYIYNKVHIYSIKCVEVLYLKSNTSIKIFYNWKYMMLAFAVRKKITKDVIYVMFPQTVNF